MVHPKAAEVASGRTERIDKYWQNTNKVPSEEIFLGNYQRKILDY